MARTPTITGAKRGEDYNLVFIIRNGSTPVDMSNGTVVLRLDTGDDALVKTEASCTMGSNGQITAPFTGSELDLRPGTYPFSIKVGIPDDGIAPLVMFDGLFLIGAN